MRVVLIQPPPRHAYERHWARVPGLGLAYIASALRAAGHDVELLDGKLVALTVDEILDRVRVHAPDLVGITCMTVEYPRAVELSQRIAQHHAAPPIVVGGAHINAVGSAALEDSAAFDFACIGEGEETVCELAAALESGTDVTRIDGLAVRRRGRVGGVRPRPYPTDYDALAFPAWDLYPRVETLPLVTHRGCPFRCVFCSHNSGFKPRYRSPDNVLDEIADDIGRHGARRIRFEDETFGLHVGRTKEILRGIVDRGFHRLARFSAQTRVDRVDEELVQLLRAANFDTLEVGVESGNADVLRRIRKGTTPDQVERAVALARGAGLRVWCKFILGHPYETRSEIRDTIDFIARLNPDQLSVSLMTPFPGTPIHDMALKGDGGYRLLAGGWEDFDKYSTGVLELETVSLAQLKRRQLACYASLYLRNHRTPELARLVLSHRALAWELGLSTISASLRPSPRRAARPAANS